MNDFWDKEDDIGFGLVKSKVYNLLLNKQQTT